MARITVEDCLDNVDNRFQLVLVATKRARQIALGSEPMVEFENDKPTVLALREIAEGFVNQTILDEEPVLDIDDDPLQSDAEDLDAALASAFGAQDLEGADISQEISEQMMENTDNQEEVTHAGTGSTEEDE